MNETTASALRPQARCDLSIKAWLAEDLSCHVGQTKNSSAILVRVGMEVRKSWGSEWDQRRCGQLFNDGATSLAPRIWLKTLHRRLLGFASQLFSSGRPCPFYQRMRVSRAALDGSKQPDDDDGGTYNSQVGMKVFLGGPQRPTAEDPSLHA